MSRIIRKVLNKSVIPDVWVAECKRVHAVGIEAGRRERDRCRRAGEDMEAAEIIMCIASAREHAVRREVVTGQLPLDAELREQEIEARVKEALAPKPRSATSLRREYRASARDLR